MIANAALGAHLAFLVWVIFGALVTSGRRFRALLHVASLIYAIVIEITLLPCPLTSIEQWALARAGFAPYSRGFLEHYLQAIIYPDVPLIVLVPAAVAVCIFNLVVYLWRWQRSWRR